MTIKIGGKEYRTSKPKDLEEQILASTGLSPAEVVAALRTGNPQPHLVARALVPFLPEGSPSAIELASEIAKEGVFAAATVVGSLYKSEAAKPDGSATDSVTA